MAKNKSSEITIDLDVQVKHLQELQALLENFKQEGKLDNTNANTFKSLMGKISETIRTLNASIKNGAVGPNGLKKISNNIDSIGQSLNKVIAQEKSTGQRDAEHLAKLKEINQEYEAQLELLEQLKNQKARSKVSDKGVVSRGDREAVMREAAAANKQKRRGPASNAEKLLSTSSYKDMKAMSLDASDPKKQKEAIAALDIYGKYVNELKAHMEDLNAQIAECNDNLSKQKALLNAEKSLGGFNEEAVSALQKEVGAMEHLKTANAETAEQMEATGEVTRKVAKDQTTLQTTTTKAAKSFIKFSVVIRTFQRMLKEGVKAVVEMDKSLTDMSIVTGESREKLQSMIPEFNKLGRATGVTATEAAGLTAEYMKQGRTIADSMELAKQTAKAAKISGISAAESVEYMTSAINGFTLAAKDAEHVSDVFAKLGATTATDYKDLAIALSKVSAQANTAGMSIEFTTSLLAKGLEVTQEAPESIGTALKTILARMRELKDYGSTLEDGASVNKVERALSSVGVALRDANGQFKDMEEIFNELGPKWDNINRMQQQAIAQAVAGTRQQSRFLAIMQDWNRTVEMSNNSLNAEGATMYQHAQYAKSLEFSINKLTTAWQGFISGLTDSNLVRNFFTFISTTLQRITEAINWLNDRTDGIVGTVTTIAVPLGLIVALIKERLQILKEEKVIRDAQYKEAVGENVTIAQNVTLEKEKTLELRKQVKIMNDQKTASDQMVDGVKNYLDKTKNSFDHMKQDFSEGGEIIKKSWNVGQVREYDKEISKLNKEREKGLITEEKFKKRQEKLEKKKNKILLKQDKDYKKNIKEKQKNENLSRKQAEEQYYLEKIKNAENEGAIQKQLDGTQKQLEAQVQQFAVEKSGTSTKAINAALDESSEQSTKDAARAAEEKVAAQQAETIPNAINDKLTESQADNENRKKKGIMAAIGAKFKEMAANASASIAQIAGFLANPVTLALALTALGVLAAVGIGVAVQANSPKKLNAKNEEKIGKNQETIYENKEKRGSLQSYLDEYEELNKKGVKTQEEQERMTEIEKAIREIDGDIKGTGDTLINNVKSEIDILKDQEKALVDTNFNLAMASASRAKGDSEIGENTKLAIKQKAEFLVDENLASSDLDATGKKAVESKMQHLVGHMTDDQIKQIASKQASDLSFKERRDLDKKVAEEKQKVNEELDNLKDLKKQGKISKDEYKQRKKELKAKRKSITRDSVLDEQSMGEVLKNATGAIGNIVKKSGGNLSEQLTAYNEEIAKLDDATKEMVKNEFGALALLSDYEGQISSILGNDNLGITEEALINFAQSLHDAGVSVEGMKGIMDKVAAGGFAGLTQMTDAEIATALGIKVEDADFADKKKQFLTNAMYDLSGTNHQEIAENRTRRESNYNNIVGLESKILSGETLSQEEEQMLADNFGDIWGTSKFQNALKKGGNKSEAIAMIEEAQAKDREKDLQEGNKLLENNKISLASEYGMSYEELAGLSPEQLKSKNLTETQIADIQKQLGEIATTQRNLDAIKNQKYTYDGLTDKDINNKNISGQMAALRKKLDAKEFDLSSDLQKMQDLQDKIAADLALELDETIKGIDQFAQGVVKVDKTTGQIVINQEKYNDLSDAQKQLFDAQLETLEEQNDALLEAKNTQEEIWQEQRDNYTAIQDKAVEIMQARLDQEYEATQKSLEKRQDLYSKYFDALDAEAEKEENEEDRTALVNKIAMLSTATDGDSLAKLKEAQQALSELDKEQAQADRELRRTAVEESFEKQNEDLDNAYNKAMENVQGMWEDFISMQEEDQIQLFKDYGEEFKNVTDYAKDIAFANLNDYIAAARDSKAPSATSPHYAEGGLVDYTGPAWVDGSKTRPEAFLDAEDTANIANLAKGLRAIMSGNTSVTNMDSSNSILNIEEFTINVDGGVSPAQSGENIAEGFMKALKDWGLNVNKNN